MKKIFLILFLLLPCMSLFGQVTAYKTVVDSSIVTVDSLIINILKYHPSGEQVLEKFNYKDLTDITIKGYGIRSSYRDFRRKGDEWKLVIDIPYPAGTHIYREYEYVIPQANCLAEELLQIGNNPKIQITYYSVDDEALSKTVYITYTVIDRSL